MSFRRHSNLSLSYSSFWLRPGRIRSMNFRLATDSVNPQWFSALIVTYRWFYFDPRMGIPCPSKPFSLEEARCVPGEGLITSGCALPGNGRGAPWVIDKYFWLFTFYIENRICRTMWICVSQCLEILLIFNAKSQTIYYKQKLVLRSSVFWPLLHIFWGNTDIEI